VPSVTSPSTSSTSTRHRCRLRSRSARSGRRRQPALARRRDPRDDVLLAVAPIHQVQDSHLDAGLRNRGGCTAVLLDVATTVHPDPGRGRTRWCSATSTSMTSGGRSTSPCSAPAAPRLTRLTPSAASPPPLSTARDFDRKSDCVARATQPADLREHPSMGGRAPSAVPWAPPTPALPEVEL